MSEFIKLPVAINAELIVDSVPKRFILIVLMIVILVLLMVIRLLIKNNRSIIKAQMELKEKNELLKSLINATPDIMCFKDGEGRWIEANEAILKLFKLGKVDYRGKNNSQLAEGKSQYMKKAFERCDKTDEDTWSRKVASRSEEVITTENKEMIILDMIKVPVYNENGTRKGLIELGRDITEHKKSEELKRKAEADEKLLYEMKQYDKLRTEFFSNISHELRTPLNVIFSALQLTELIQGKDISETNINKMKECTSVMRQNSYRLIRIVNNIIDISKIDSGYFQLKLQNFNIVSVVEDITLSVKDYVESKGINLIFDTDVEEKVIACDVDLMERILLNIMSNAVKFTDKGGNINVNIYNGIEKISIKIRDTGMGIPKEKLNCIFNRFIQVDKSLSRNKEGSGIGLSLVKSLVEMQEGEVRVESEWGKGSCFIVELPAKPLEECNNDSIAPQEGVSINIERINIEFSDIYS